MENRKLNWGIIGTGVIAHEMAEALTRSNKSLMASAATSMEKAEKFTEKYGIEKAYSSAADLLHDPEIDIVYIATPHISHYELMKEALLHGKHVMAEKSVTVNAEQLHECEKIAREKNLVISDGTTLLHMPLYREIKKQIDEGLIGQVKMIQVNFGSCKEYDVNNRFFKKELAGGALLDIGVYAVSFARYFMSSKPDLILTAANFFETGVDETSGIILRNPESEMAVIALTMRAKQPKRGVIAGEKGYIEIYDYPRADRASVTMTEDGSVTWIEAGSKADALAYEAQDVEDYIRHQKDGQKNLTLVSDVMDVLTDIRRQWNMIYPGE